MHAAARRRSKAMSVLVESRALVGTADVGGLTALHWAAAGTHEQG